MTRNLFSVRDAAAIGVVLLFPFAVGSQAPADTPDNTIRQLVRAMYAADGAGFRKLALPDPRIHLLTTGGRVNADGLRELDEDPTGVQIIPKRPFEYRGARVTDGKYPVGTTAVYVVAHHRSPMVVVMQREPSGHLDALAMEMPIVELKPGEFRRLPMGGIIEGTNQPDRKVLLGLFGSVEMPFVLRKVGPEWRVEPQPYFLLINQ